MSSETPLASSSTGSPPAEGVPCDHRRKWNREEYQAIAEKRLAEDQNGESGSGGDEEFQSPHRRSFLKPREFKLSLEANVGKSVIVNRKRAGGASESSAHGYYCNVCDCVVKDSINFLDHINGKKHQRNMGMSMRIEKSTVEQVRERFRLNKEKLEEKKKKYDLSDRLECLHEEAMKMKEKQRERRRERKKRKLEQTEKSETRVDGADDEEDAILAMMGFSNFSSK